MNFHKSWKKIDFFVEKGPVVTVSILLVCIRSVNVRHVYALAQFFTMHGFVRPSRG